MSSAMPAANPRARTMLVVVGDLLLDRDVEGGVSRVCPDAPVPVIDVEAERVRAGGAGLAARLAAADGADVTLVTAVDDGAEARLAVDLLRADGIRVVTAPRDGAIPVKTRLRAQGQSIARLDRGIRGPVACGPWKHRAFDALGEADVVLVSDYGGGMTGSPGVRAGIAEAAARVPVVWDPHPRGDPPVPGCSLVTPNRHEAGVESLASAALMLRVGRALAASWRADAVSITLGADGAAVALPRGGVVVPARGVRTVDVCGAGDRFATAAALALGDGLTLDDAVQTAVEASSAFVATETPWSRAPTTAGLAEPLVPPPHRPVVVSTSGCFDLLHAGHVRMLRAARALGERLVVCLNDDASVRRLKGEGRPIVPAEERGELLLALECVDEVVRFPEDTPERALDRLRPDVFVKGADYRLEDLPETTLLASWGGETVILPYDAGRSTTELIARSRESVGAARS